MKRKLQQARRRPSNTRTIESLETRLMLSAASGLDSQHNNDPSNEHDSTAILDAVADVVDTNGERSHDGTGNNIANPELGSVGEQLVRIADAEYSDGISTPAGEDRPGAREISNAVATQNESIANERGTSAFLFAWGQFIDHDIDLTGPATTTEFFPIEVPTGDPFFDPDETGTQIIPLTRSVFDETTGTDADNPRQQINEITAWIDGSMVYGSNDVTAAALREFSGGRLLTSDGNLPPVDENGHFIVGDIRGNENVALTSMHTLFIREHNLWANRIAANDPTLDDEAIYQQARSIVIAEIQAITFNEFLPALLGTDAIDDFAGYDPTVDPGIANEFSTAAFRLHTIINEEIRFLDNDGQPIRESVPLAEAFFNPDLLRETGADPLLKFLASSQTEEFDTQVIDSLRNFLFGQPGSGGFDLAALNIQRGRDHGLADYNTVREAYGLERVTSFAEITSDVGLQQQLESLYGDVDNIDLWVGALAEDRVPGAGVGELVQTIVADQFERLRDGDRFWYESTFTGDVLAQLQSTTLADVISRNTSIDNLQNNVFFLHSEVRGTVFADRDGDSRNDRREDGLNGITVELLDYDGNVIATTVTNSRGRYSFDDFTGTGTYQLRITLPNRFEATTPTTVDIAITRGDESLRVDFGVEKERETRRRPHRRSRDDGPGRRSDSRRRDSVFESPGLVEWLSELEDGRGGRRRR